MECVMVERIGDGVDAALKRVNADITARPFIRDTWVDSPIPVWQTPEFRGTFETLAKGGIGCFILLNNSRKE